MNAADARQERITLENEFASAALVLFSVRDGEAFKD